jgi:hypothetical protein
VFSNCVPSSRKVTAVIGKKTRKDAATPPTRCACACVQEVITSYEEFEANHAQSMRNRTTAPTLLNAHSSRSHFMVIIKVHMMQQAPLWGMHVYPAAG